MIPPYLGPALGLDLDVRPAVEVVDHVLAGAVAALCAGLAALRSRIKRTAGSSALPRLLRVATALGHREALAFPCAR